MFSKQSLSVVFFLLVPPMALPASSNLNIELSGPVSRQTVQVECDANGAKMGLPLGPFSVEYINGGGNSLAILPVSGQPLIFANVLSGSGARYVAKQFTWWDAAGRDITFSSDTLGGKMRSLCHHAPPAAKH